MDNYELGRLIGKFTAYLLVALAIGYGFIKLIWKKK
jgi:hypothetical protein